MPTRKTDLKKLETTPRKLIARHATQPEENGALLLKLLDAWTADKQPETHEEAFLCRELATLEWRLERLRRIENGLIWWAIDDIRDRNHDAEQYGHPTGEEEMDPEDFFTLMLARGFKFAASQQDALVKLARIETALSNRMYKALERLAKRREVAGKTGTRTP